MLHSLALNGTDLKSVTDADIDGVLQLKSLSKLAILNCQHVTDKVATRISQLPLLTHLALCNNLMLTSAAMTTITQATQARTHITHLDLSKYRQLKDQTFVAIAKFTSLSILNVRGCRDLSAQFVLRIPLDGALKSLTDLDLSFCINTTAITCQHLCTHLPQLLSLRLVGCTQMDDVAMQCLSRLTSLTSLDISFCENISDEGIDELARNDTGRTLKQLVMRGCIELTNDTLHSVSEMDAIQYIDVSFCTKMRGRAKTELWRTVPHLKMVWL